MVLSRDFMVVFSNFYESCLVLLDWLCGSQWFYFRVACSWFIVIVYIVVSFVFNVL